jgi:hypothetical protein
MRDAKQVLEQYFLEMRWRCVSLAADLDRIERGAGGNALIQTDPRLQTLNKALRALVEASGNRAEQVQLLFSDRTPAPHRTSEARNPK